MNKIINIYLIKFQKDKGEFGKTTEVNTFEGAFTTEKDAWKKIEEIEKPFYDYWVEEYPIIK
jgi:hypothetical protein